MKKPVAKVMRIKPRSIKRKRLELDEHMRWMKKVYGNKIFDNGDEQLAAARADRKLI